MVYQTKGSNLFRAAILHAAQLHDHDIVVITSKVFSKAEGRLVPAPTDPEQRDALRRRLVEDESVRVVARKNRTLITENAIGLVQAAAGVDGSNVSVAELALLPVDPDGSAARLRTDLSERLGVTVAVVITDTMGRAWRTGQTDAAIGAAGLTAALAHVATCINCAPLDPSSLAALPSPLPPLPAVPLAPWLCAQTMPSVRPWS